MHFNKEHFSYNKENSQLDTTIGNLLTLQS